MANDQPVAPLSDNAPQPSISTQPDQLTPNAPAPLATPATAPTQPISTAAPTTQPNTNAPAVRSAASNVPTNPQELHQSIFKNVLGMLTQGSGRPQMGPNGQPAVDQSGNVIMQPGNVKTLGASILAGALSGLVAAQATPDRRTDLGGGRSIADNSGAAAAGAQAGSQFSGPARKAAAQGQVDANQVRQYATVDHNLKLHNAQLNNEKLQGELLKEGVDTDAPIIEGLTQAQPITDPSDPSKTIDAIQEQNVTNTRLQELMNSTDPAVHVTRDSVLRDGVINVYDSNGKQVFNADGTPTKENTYTVYNHNAQVLLSEQMKGMSPNLKDVAVGTSVPVAVLSKYAREQSVVKAATAGITSQIDGYNSANKDNKEAPAISNFSLQKAMVSSPIIKSILPQIGKYGTDPLDLMFKDLRADKTVSDVALGALQSAMGVTEQGLETIAQNRIEAQNAAKKGNDALPAPAAQVGSFPADIKTAYPNLTAGQVNLLTKALGKTPTNADYVKQQETAQKYSDNNTKMDANQAAKDTAAIAKGQKPVVGVDASGRQVLVPAGDVSKYGLSQVREVGQAENEKVTNARSLMTVFSNDDKDDLGLIQLATKLNKEGKLGPVATRFSDWLNKGGSVTTFNVGDDPRVQQLFTKLGLSTTGLMQVHVGARGSAAMMEHFADLANAKTCLLYTSYYRLRLRKLSERVSETYGFYEF